jgi:hypothetical protein
MRDLYLLQEVVEISTVAVEHRLLAGKPPPALHRNVDISRCGSQNPNPLTELVLRSSKPLIFGRNSRSLSWLH